MRIALLLAATALLSSAGCSKGSDQNGGGDQKPAADAPNPLKAAAKGTWKGPYGTVTFKDDGTVDVDIKNCGEENLAPGQVRVFPPDAAACSAEKRTGKLEIEGDRIGVKMPDNMTYLYAAYVDKAGKLHFAVGGADEPINHLGADRKGSIKVSMFQTLTIGDTCELADKMKDTKKAVPCRWEEKDGRSIFIYSAPDRFDPTKTNEVGLVHLKDEGLLVAPAIIDLVFEKGA